ncbi:MAG TPA: SCO6880 family protein [Solirubrobacteraceae bacterium]|nr:SCO6880 family protein [Solirubrobacteraceae bacterium]
MTDERLTYRFGPVERRGLLGQLRAGQAGVVAFGVVAGIAILDREPTAAGAFVGMVALGASLAVAFAPVGRRTAEEWAPIALSFALRWARRRLHFRSRAPTAGTLASEGPVTLAAGTLAAGRSRPVRRLLGQSWPHPPATLKDVRILDVPYEDRTIGVLSEGRRRRLTAVLACRVVSFSLLDPEAQERRLARWGLVLSGAAGSRIRRIQWLERTAPAQGDELARWLHDEHDPHIPLRGTPMIESYLELIGATTRASHEHEVLVAVQIDARRGADRGRGAAATTLIEETERVAQGIEAAEVTVLGALGGGQLARALRTAFDPYARAELATLEAADPGRNGLAEANAWPLGAREHWEDYRADGALHATFWIAQWPRVDVSPMFMDALLGRSSVVRTAAVTFEPIAPARSTREAEAAVTRDHADRELRHRFGQAETARQRQAQEAAVRREAELAAGHAEVRLAGFVTVSGRDPDDLRRACAEVHEQTVRARLELHRMYGQQADAFTFTLPLCRGLR